MSDSALNPEPVAEAAPKAEAKADIVRLVEQMAKLLVDQPEQVLVDMEHDRGEDVYWLEVAPDDIGKVIGKQGRTVRSLRTIVEAAGARQNRRATLEIVEEDDDDGGNGDNRADGDAG